MAPQSDSEDEEVWNLLAGCAEESEAPEVTAAPALPSADADAAAAAMPAACAGALGGGGDRCCGGAAAAAPPAPGGCCAGRATAAADAPEEAPAVAAPPQRRRPGPSAVAAAAGRGGRVPPEILEDPELNDAIAKGLPKSHNFEVHKTVWRLRRCGSRHVGLQLPEGLQEWATTLCDIFSRFVPTMETTTILGDVTFGACCIDDLGARAVGVDCLVHYGHSCIVPTDQTTVNTIYVLVDVDIDVDHLVETVKLNFASDRRIAFMGTVQFTPGTLKAVDILRKEHFLEGKVAAPVPQIKPLSVGETLGCTSALVGADIDAIVFVSDGRFHLESAMIQNPHVKGGFYRYDPFYQTLTREGFAYEEMHQQRKAAIEAAKGARMVGLVLSTLGRQGSSGVLEGVEQLLQQRGVPHLTVLLSDVSPDRLSRFQGVDAWVQVACPRLSIDWGDAYEQPLLTPYEAHIAWGDAKYQDVYPMDYYSNRGGPWSNYGAHNGHGGSLGTKFRHLGRKRLVEYDEAQH